MEAALRKYDDGAVVKEENRDESNVADHKEGCNKEDIVLKDYELESAEAEMGEVIKENQRLRMHLNQMMKDYKTLQMQLNDIVGEETKESELVSLSLGRSTSSDQRIDHEKPRKGKKDDQEDKGGLALGLDCKFEVTETGTSTETSLKPSPEYCSSGEVKSEDMESWPPHKVLKTMRSSDDLVSQQNPMKKARVSVRARCDAPTMNDGCQWRKYGQKIAKGNPCPRAYYRCTVGPSCPVRKQVQRCAQDMSILITTYEGTHNHPLSMSATAMASTTSAAASMLISGSSTSDNTPPSTANRHESSLSSLFDHNSKPKQFYLPNSSISYSSSHPTITLDLTSSSSSSSSSYHFNKRSSNFFPTPRFSSTNLNFSSLESNLQPMYSWSKGVPNYEAQPYNKNQVISSLNFGRQTQQPLPEDSIAAATKAITSDPSFQSTLAAALASIIGGSGSGGDGGGGTLGQNLKLGETFPLVSNFLSTTPSANKCSSKYLNRSSAVTNSHQ